MKKMNRIKTFRISFLFIFIIILVFCPLCFSVDEKFQKDGIVSSETGVKKNEINTAATVVLSNNINPLTGPSPTFSPTINNLDNLPYLLIYVSQPGIYRGSSLKKQFIITSTGATQITGNGGKSYYKLSPAVNSTLYITDFQIGLDILDLSQFTYVTNIELIDYSTAPLAFYLAHNQQIIFSSLTYFDLTTKNVILAKPPDSSSSSSNNEVLSPPVLSAISILGGLLMTTLIGYQVYMNYYHKSLAEKLQEKQERVKSKMNSANSSFRSNGSKNEMQPSKNNKNNHKKSSHSSRKVGISPSEKGSKRITNDFLPSEDGGTNEVRHFNERNDDLESNSPAPPRHHVSAATPTSTDDDEEEEEGNDSSPHRNLTKVRVKRPSMPAVLEDRSFGSDQSFEELAL
jgi:hypothetical protein